MTPGAVLLSLHREPATEVLLDPFDEDLQIAWPLNGRGAASSGVSLAEWQGLGRR